MCRLYTCITCMKHVLHVFYACITRVWVACGIFTSERRKVPAPRLIFVCPISLRGEGRGVGVLSQCCLILPHKLISNRCTQPRDNQLFCKQVYMSADFTYKPYYLIPWYSIPPNYLKPNHWISSGWWRGEEGLINGRMLFQNHVGQDLKKKSCAD